MSGFKGHGGTCENGVEKVAGMREAGSLEPKSPHGRQKNQCQRRPLETLRQGSPEAILVRKNTVIVDFTCLVAKQGQHLLNLPCCLLVLLFLDG